MPNIFLSGRVEFDVNDEEELLDNVMSAMESGRTSIEIIYRDKGLSNQFEFMLREKESGVFDITRTSPTSVKVLIDGVLKTGVIGAALKRLVDEEGPWIIRGISSRDWSAEAKPSPDTSGLKMTKKAPKAAKA